jgi:Lon protease-like protein
MSTPLLIPMFPLTLLPLPGELVPLHIFEPRYRQLLQDAETLDISFGIYCNHELNKARLGSLMKLESVIKRYPDGESDVIVRCSDIFTMDKLYRSFKTKNYPAGDVHYWNVNTEEIPNVELYQLFLEYQAKRNINHHFTTFNIYQVAAELNLDLYDRYKFLNYSPIKRYAFLTSHIQYQLHILNQENKSKDLFHLN